MTCPSCGHKNSKDSHAALQSTRALRMAPSQCFAAIQSGSAVVRWRFRRASSSTIGRQGNPRSSATLTSRSSVVPDPRSRAGPSVIQIDVVVRPTSPTCRVSAPAVGPNLGCLCPREDATDRDIIFEADVPAMNCATDWGLNDQQELSVTKNSNVDIGHRETPRHPAMFS